VHLSSLASHRRKRCICLLGSLAVRLRESGVESIQQKCTGSQGSSMMVMLSCHWRKRHHRSCHPPGRVATRGWGHGCGVRSSACREKKLTSTLAAWKLTSDGYYQPVEYKAITNLQNIKLLQARGPNPGCNKRTRTAATRLAATAAMQRQCWRSWEPRCGPS
jgi:hypothetical protein